MGKLYHNMNAMFSIAKGAAAAAVAVTFLCLASIAMLFVTARRGHPRFMLSVNVGIESEARDFYDFPALARSSNFSEKELETLVSVLSNAALKDTRTAFIAPLNKAWAAEGSMFDNFLESFRQGEGTSYLVDHLVIIALDQAAYNRCLSVHKHCFELRTQGVDFSEEKLYKTKDYLKMVKRKVYFLGLVLQLGFNFIFTDIDVMWFRPPFRHFSKDADFEVACDAFNGNSSDLNNAPNVGVLHVHSNERTVRLYNYWYQQHEAHPGLHNQDVFNNFKHTPEFHHIGVKIKFMPTQYFGGFCQVSRDLEKVCTMHAACCKGLHNKLADLKLVLDDWRLFKSMTPQESQEQGVHFRAPQKCRMGH